MGSLGLGVHKVCLSLLSLSGGEWGLILNTPTRNILTRLELTMDFPHSSVGEESACSEGDLGSIPELGRSPREGNGNHSSTFAWRILLTEESGRLLSMGSQELDTT